jgi:hypothetical protein
MPLRAALRAPSVRAAYADVALDDRRVLLSDSAR